MYISYHSYDPSYWKFIWFISNYCQKNVADTWHNNRNLTKPINSGTCILLVTHNWTCTNNQYTNWTFYYCGQYIWIVKDACEPCSYDKLKLQYLIDWQNNHSENTWTVEHIAWDHCGQKNSSLWPLKMLSACIPENIQMSNY